MSDENLCKINMHNNYFRSLMINSQDNVIQTLFLIQACVYVYFSKCIFKCATDLRGIHEANHLNETAVEVIYYRSGKACVVCVIGREPITKS